MTSSSSTSDSEDECQLGRLDHWEKSYAQELHNFHELGDEGEIWFGQDVLETMISWTVDLILRQTEEGKKASILDLGTGNGSFLFELEQRGFSKLTGCDYSAASLELTEAISRKRGINTITWLKDDILESGIHSRFRVLTDKGTLDAVGLSASAKENRIRYKHSVWQLLEPGGLLVITSCNSTAAELQEELCLCESGIKFEFVDRVRTYPVFRFGGVEGTKVCTVAFQKLYNEQQQNE